ncbi:ISCps7, transposase [gamma proteobacterium NOR5-3]|nr:ISCps7, transposase [gamma proteobacterium NOR5-3]
MNNPSKNNTQINVGIDTSQSQLDIYVRPTGHFFSQPNTPVGAKAAVAALKALRPDRINIEATGRLEFNLVHAAHKAQLPVAVCNPGSARLFAQSIGRTAKTDKLDAMDLAHFGEATQPRLTPQKPEKLRLISDLLTVRSQCLKMSTMQKNRLKRMPASVHSHIKSILKTLQKEIAAIDKKVDKLASDVPEWKAQRDLLMSAKGVGRVLAYTLMSELPELVLGLSNVPSKALMFQSNRLMDSLDAM